MPERHRDAAWLMATPLLPWLGLLPGVGAWVLPFVAPLTVWLPFRRAVREERSSAAFAIALLWALLLSAGIVTMVQCAPQRAAQAILHGEPYRAEMFAWIQTGAGAEVDPHRFLPVHALHLTAFLLVSVASGGYLGLVLGAGLVGFMSYFVGSFAAASASPLGGALVAWVPWSVVRVLSFVLLGVLAARPVLLRRRWPFGATEIRLGLLALAGLVVDVASKWLLAPGYGRFLRLWLEGSAGP